MKFWECINIPGMTNVDVSSEDAKTSAPSLADATVLSVGNVEPDMKEAIKKAVEETEPVQVAANDVMSQSYLNMRAAAFGTTPTAVQEEITVEETAEDTEYTPEELDAKQGYVSVDEVDFSQYDTDGKFEVPEDDEAPDDMVLEVSNPTEDTVMVTETRAPAIDNEKLLASILTHGDNEIVVNENPVPLTTEEVDTPTETEQKSQYNLTAEELENVIDTINRYEETYFKGIIPAYDFSKKFLMNIPRAVYIAHIDVVEKYEYPDIMDPLFYLYILISKFPRDAMGMFINILTGLMNNNPDWCDIAADESKKYAEYIANFPEELEKDVE